ncbi:replication protein [Stutzerimonas stutzeri]|uniref:replication protein n=1 Tax=Stutzerimonas stutzeri TaxID=316 RepID=UPI000D20C84E|nr:replication protein [Stutzerimonas stutzeri]AVX13824.1 phage replication protein [Stutzerimonas stutzeri]
MTNVIQIGNTQRGFTRMDNSIMEALAAVDLPAREFRVVMAIARQTIGYNVESKRLSADEIGKLTNMRRDVVSKAISHLLERRIIFRVGGSRGELGVSPSKEWTFYEEKKARLSETKSSHSAQIVSLVSDASETKTATSLLYTKKEPLVTVPSEQITAPQGGEPTQVEKDSGVSFDGEDFQVSSDLITKWAKAYAPVDVETEIVRAAAWASGAKPKKDWRRFLVNWLARAHRKAAGTVNEAGVPVDKIIDLYQRVCPNLPKVAVASDKTLRGLIVERWTEAETHQNSQFWKTIFDKANRLSQVYYRGANVAPRLEIICSRAVFRQLEEQA